MDNICVVTIRATRLAIGERRNYIARLPCLAERRKGPFALRGGKVTCPRKPVMEVIDTHLLDSRFSSPTKRIGDPNT
jgi:hypothetical protein